MWQTIMRGYIFPVTGLTPPVHRGNAGCNVGNHEQTGSVEAPGDAEYQAVVTFSWRADYHANVLSYNGIGGW
jgi:hypothetical protein